MKTVARDKKTRALLKKLEEKVTEYEVQCGKGTCSKYSEYKKTCGIIAGLKLAMDITLDNERGFERDDDAFED